MRTATNLPPEQGMEEFETVLVNQSGETIQRQKCRCKTYLEDLGGGVGLELVEIPAGIIRMGTTGFGGYEDERPSHLVSVQAFLMGEYQVTQQQWDTVTRKEKPYRGKGLRRPADRVTWIEAGMFCKMLSKKSGRPYRLPSEAEWEYACRAGTGSAFSFGETITTDLANYVGEYTFQSEPKGIYRHGSSEVGQFLANAFGLFDMHGNVWEWCADDWHDDYAGAPPDGSAWKNRFESAFKVLRGGSWHEPPINCRSATRLKMDQREGEDFFGFRVALSG